MTMDSLQTCFREDNIADLPSPWDWQNRSLAKPCLMLRTMPVCTRLASRPYLSESSRFRFYLLIALLVHVDVQGVHTSDQGCRYLKQEQAHQSKYCSNRNPRSNMAGTSIFDRVTHDCIQHDAFEPWMCWDFCWQIAAWLESTHQRSRRSRVRRHPVFQDHLTAASASITQPHVRTHTHNDMGTHFDKGKQ